MQNFQNQRTDYDFQVRMGDKTLDVCHFSFPAIVESKGEDFNMRQMLPTLAADIQIKEVIVDSDLTLRNAFQNLPKNCPEFIVAAQELLRVYYFGLDNKLHVGQVLLHRDLENDIRDLFNQVILPLKLPVGSMIPVAMDKIDWDDYQSMNLNNGSAFNFRQIINPDGSKKRLSLHALGLAFDINPLYNPCYGKPNIGEFDMNGKEVAAGYQSFIPEKGIYDLSLKQTMTDRHPIVLFLEERGWTWGGRWGNPRDFHHFQKIPAYLADEVQFIRNNS